ncbi:MAG: S8 family serine peptidase [Candidatus Margulisiibacteriota bacterium]
MKRIPAFLFVFALLSSHVFAVQIDLSVLKQMKSASSDKISAIVYMKDDVDMSLLPAKRADRAAFLDRFSMASQKNVSDSLEAHKKSGKISIIKRFWTFNAFLIVADKSVIEELAKRSDILRIAINQKVTLLPEPEVEPSAIINTFSSSTLEANIAQIKADKVWTGYGIRGKGVKVGVADTGCLDTHADLAGKIALKASFDSSGNKISDTAIPVPVLTGIFDGGHGTHVAGIIAGGNASGKSIGVAPDATLLIAKVFDDSTDSNYAQVFGGVEWLIANGARVINLSLGGPAGDAVNDWKTKVDRWNSILGVVVVCAVGNSGSAALTTSSPGNVPNALGVGAVDSSDTIASFSSRGPIVWSSVSYTKPDVCAPGVVIKSSYMDGNYKSLNGTSMASPHVAGVAALMLEANPTLEANEIKNIIKNNTEKKSGVLYPSNDYGWGRIDAFAAVTNSTGPDTNPPIIDHTPVSSSKFGEDITASATVTDNRTTSPTVVLYYKNSDNVWETVSMSLEAGSTSLYKAAIPASKVNSDIQYYIKATDLANNSSTYPIGVPATLTKTSVLAQDALTVSGVSPCPSPYSGVGDLAFSFYLSKPAQTDIRIFSMTGETIKRIEYSGVLGYNSVLWDGTTVRAEKVGNGPYIYQIVFKDTLGSIQKTKGKFMVLK